jgi:two-component system cell cycle sensor histidine kinase/response regulator CckA
LIVEDSADEAELLLRELRRGDYDAQFERVDSSTAMSAALDRKAWDVVICDYSLPHFSGVDALRLLRARSSEIPFIFLSGTIGEDAAVAALKEGAQDYIMKGNLMRLLPAIQRELQEAEARKERSRMERQLQQLQKFEAIGRLAGSIAHVPSLRSLHRTATVRAASQSY